MLAGFSGLSAGAAFIGASCCVLPLILFNIGVGSAAIAQLAFFAEYRDYFLLAGALLVAVSLFAAFHGGRRPSKKMIFVFGGTLVLLLVAYLMPFFERDLLRLLNLR